MLSRLISVRKLLVLASLLLGAGSARAQLVPEVRRATGARDFARAEAMLETYRHARGTNPEFILATSWVARGAQAAQDWERAERYAAETRRLALEEIKKRPLDAEPDLPLALGASIEVQAHSLAARRKLADALAFLNTELKTWRATSIRARIQKNLHLLNLQGKAAPQLDVSEYLGEKPPALAQLRGQPVILFFWAHWCGDCKQQKPVLDRLQQEYAKKGLVIVGPTRRYGYVAGGVEAAPAQELQYIEQVRNTFYGSLQMAVPVSEENFDAWGCSSSPTLAVLDRSGKVILYNPGRLSYEKLAPIVAQAVNSR